MLFEVEMADAARAGETAMLAGEPITGNPHDVDAADAPTRVLGKMWRRGWIAALNAALPDPADEAGDDTDTGDDDYLDPDDADVAGDAEESVTETTEKRHTGGMVALLPNAESAAALAVDGGTPIGRLHCTLAYLGDDVTGWDDGLHAEVLDVAKQLVRERAGVIRARAFGHTTFNPDGGPDGDREPCAVYQIGDSRELTPLHEQTVGLLGRTDIALPVQHAPFVPHVTAGFGLTAADLSYTGQVVFDRLVVALGDVWVILPLDDRAPAAESGHALLAESLDELGPTATAWLSEAGAGAWVDDAGDLWLWDVEEARYVRTPAGAKRYGLPIGSLIVSKGAKRDATMAPIVRAHKKALAKARAKHSGGPAGKAGLASVDEGRVETRAKAIEADVQRIVTDAVQRVRPGAKSPADLSPAERVDLANDLRGKAGSQIKAALFDGLARDYPEASKRDRDAAYRSLVRATTQQVNPDQPGAAPEGRGIRLALRALERAQAARAAGDDHAAVVESARKVIGDPRGFGRRGDDLDVDDRDGGIGEGTARKLEALRAAGAALAAAAERRAETDGISIAAARRAVLADVRPMGPDGGNRLTWRFDYSVSTEDKRQLAPVLTRAQAAYPADWIAANAEARPNGLRVSRSSARGYYRASTHSLDVGTAGTGNEQLNVTVHELGHSMEYTNPHLIAAEWAYLRDRTSTGGPGSRKSDAVTALAGRDSERGLRDDFPSHYTGRLYTDEPGQDRAYEVLTTGVESVFGSSKYADADMEHFILGVFALL